MNMQIVLDRETEQIIAKAAGDLGLAPTQYIRMLTRQATRQSEPGKFPEYNKEIRDRPVRFNLSDKEHEYLTRLSEESGLTMVQVVRMALNKL